jgi:hypothetical protein
LWTTFRNGLTMKRNPLEDRIDEVQLARKIAGTMKSIKSRGVYWAALALLIFLVLKAPAAMGHMLIALVNGVGVFLGKL